MQKVGGKLCRGERVKRSEGRRKLFAKFLLSFRWGRFMSSSCVVYCVIIFRAVTMDRGLFGSGENSGLPAKVNKKLSVLKLQFTRLVPVRRKQDCNFLSSCLKFSCLSTLTINFCSISCCAPEEFAHVGMAQKIDEGGWLLNDAQKDGKIMEELTNKNAKLLLLFLFPFKWVTRD